MRIASICAASALALGFIHGPVLAQNPPPAPLPTISEREEVRNTYIFKFDDSVPRGEMHERAQQALAGTGGTLRHVYTEVLGGFAATVPGSAIWNVARRPGIVSFERDEIVTIAGHHWCDIDHWKCDPEAEPDPEPEPEPEPTPGAELTCDVDGTEPWGIKRIKAPAAEDCGLGIHVYVIDTGIDLDHPSLMPVGDSVDCTKGPSCVQGGDGDDDHGHGSHVAGTVGARGPDVVGVAPGVYLHSVKVLKSNGMGFRSDIIAGIHWVVTQVKDNKPVVANLSLGGSGEKKGTCSAAKFEGDDSYHQAFCDAARAGVVFVVAAGNSGADAEKSAPASYDDAVITVSATEEGDDWPSWSNWGKNPRVGWSGPETAPVAIAAPGVKIVSAKMGGGTTSMNGTSMASPHVAGVAALLIESTAYDSDEFSENPYIAFLDIREAILGDAELTGSFSNTSDNPHDENFACAANCSE